MHFPLRLFPRSSDLRSTLQIRDLTGLRKHFRATGLALTQPKATSVPVAPRCDVTASQLDAQETGRTSPAFFCALRNHSARVPPAAVDSRQRTRSNVEERRLSAAIRAPRTRGFSPRRLFHNPNVHPSLTSTAPLAYSAFCRARMFKPRDSRSTPGPRKPPHASEGQWDICSGRSGWLPWIAQGCRPL